PPRRTKRLPQKAESFFLALSKYAKLIRFSVMAGLVLACPGHPRLPCCRCYKTCWGGRPPHGIECAKLAFATKRRRPSMNEIIRIGIDLSKRVFQVHGVNGAEQTVLRRTLRRDQMERFFAALPATLIGMEACGSAHHWARVLQGLGH